MFRQISRGVSGNIIAQIIVLTTTPILTRLYSPEVYGELALFVAILSVATIVASGRYEMAIPVAKGRDEVVSLAIISTGLVVVFSIVLFFFVFSLEIFYGITSLFLLLPLSVFAISLNLILTQYIVREGRLDLIAKAKISQSISMASSQIGGAFILGPVTLSLILGQVLGQIASIASLWQSDKDLIGSKKDSLLIWKTLQRYSNFPRFMIISGVLSSIVLQAPTFVSSYFFGFANTGLLALGQRLMSIPVDTIAMTVSQVLTSKFSSSSSSLEKQSIFVMIFTRSVFLGVAIAIGGILLEPYLFILFGNEWKGVENIITPLAILGGVRFVGFCLAPTLVLLEKLKIALLLDFLKFLGIILIIIFINELSFVKFVQIYSFHLSLCYIIQIFISWLVLTDTVKREAGHGKL